MCITQPFLAVPSALSSDSFVRSAFGTHHVDNCKVSDGHLCDVHHATSGTHDQEVLRSHVDSFPDLRVCDVGFKAFWTDIPR